MDHPHYQNDGQYNHLKDLRDHCTITLRGRGYSEDVGASVRSPGLLLVKQHAPS